MLKVEVINNLEATTQEHDRDDNWAFCLTDSQVAELIKVLKQPFPFQAQVFLTADNDMVKDVYTHYLSGFSQPLGQLYVIFRSFRVT